MRAKIIAATGFVACLGLYGCDDPATAPQAAVQAAPPPCNCQAPVAAAPAATVQASVHHRRHWSAYAYSSHEDSESYSQGSQSDESQSRSYDESDSQSSQASSAQNVWVDGYGRSHYILASAVTVSQSPETGARRDPWHGYDENCDEKK